MATRGSTADRVRAAGLRRPPTPSRRPRRARRSSPAPASSTTTRRTGSSSPRRSSGLDGVAALRDLCAIVRGLAARPRAERVRRVRRAARRRAGRGAGRRRRHRARRGRAEVHPGAFAALAPLRARLGLPRRAGAAARLLHARAAAARRPGRARPRAARSASRLAPAEPLPDWWDGDDAPLVYLTLGTVAPRWASSPRSTAPRSTRSRPLRSACSSRPAGTTIPPTSARCPRRPRRALGPAGGGHAARRGDGLPRRVRHRPRRPRGGRPARRPAAVRRPALQRRAASPRSAPGSRSTTSAARPPRSRALLADPAYRAAPRRSPPTCARCRPSTRPSPSFEHSPTGRRRRGSAVLPSAAQMRHRPTTSGLTRTRSPRSPTTASCRTARRPRWSPPTARSSGCACRGWTRRACSARSSTATPATSGSARPA